MSKKWKYKNNTDKTIIWKDKCWPCGAELELPYPVPVFLELTCTQEGDVPDPVLFHNDVLISPNDTVIINLSSPLYCSNISLSLSCMGQGGVECRFNSENNKPVPLDVRGFVHIMPWEMCSRIYLKNITEVETHISITAVEVFG